MMRSSDRLAAALLVAVTCAAQTGARAQAGQTPAPKPAQTPAPAPAPPATPTKSPAQGQRRSVGSATLVVLVTDPAGAPLGDVKVTVTGPQSRDRRTERGRMALESLPYGTYHLKFERAGFTSVEQDVIAKSAAPIDVKVTMEPEAPAAPPPQPEPPPPPPPPPPSTAKPVVLDIPAFLEKNFVGRGARKESLLGCSGSGPAVLMQFRDTIAEHTHSDADEYLYVIAGSGSVRMDGSDRPLGPSVFVLVPRGMPHLLTATGKNPLVALSVKAGAGCPQ